MDIDTWVASAVAVLYVVLTIVLLPPNEYPRAVGGALLLFAAVVGVAQWLGRGPLPGMSVFAVAVVSAVILEIPTFPAMGGTHPVAVPLGFLGMQAAMLLWAARRWVPLPPPIAQTSLAKAWKVGASAALVLSAVATIPVLLLIHEGGHAQLPFLLVYPAYFAGLLAAATIYWLLQRIAHLAVGRYLIGFLGGVFVYGAVAPIVALTDHEPLDITMMLVISCVCGGLVGPAVALNRTGKRALVA